MLVTLLGIATLVRLLQSTNACSMMLVTLLGIVTPVSVTQPLKALLPMLVTGRPLIVLGMVTGPPKPLYLVIVITPLFVVKLYSWICTVGRPPKVDRKSVV